ncbi:MAG: hypothetical protein ACPGU7_09825, partial [Gammaproteobacteria bacterium]
IDGAGSSIDLVGSHAPYSDLNVEGEGTSSLNIQNGASVNLANRLNIGNSAGTSGSVTISGNSASLITSEVLIGELGFGSLKVWDGGTVQANSITVGDGGRLEGTGTVIGDITVSGELNPGQSPGQLDIVGNLTLADASSTLIEIEGLTQGIEYDFINVDGDVFLDGLLEFTFLNSFSASIGDSFTFLSATGGIFGSFDSVILPSQVGIDFALINDGLGNLILEANDANAASVPLPVTLWLLLAGLTLLARRNRAL